MTWTDIPSESTAAETGYPSPPLFRALRNNAADTRARFLASGGHGDGGVHSAFGTANLPGGTVAGIDRLYSGTQAVDKLLSVASPNTFARPLWHTYADGAVAAAVNWHMHGGGYMFLGNPYQGTGTWPAETHALGMQSWLSYIRAVGPFRYGVMVNLRTPVQTNIDAVVFPRTAIRGGLRGVQTVVENLTGLEDYYGDVPVDVEADAGIYSGACKESV